MRGGAAATPSDRPKEPVNKFSESVIAGFDTILGELERNPAVQAAVLISGKPDAFIAGADIDAFLEFKGAPDAEAASAMGHRMMLRLEGSRAPVVAAIHGGWLGGGLEDALACADSVATDPTKHVFPLSA